MECKIPSVPAPHLTWGGRVYMTLFHAGISNIAHAAREWGFPTETVRGWIWRNAVPHDIAGAARTISAKTGVDVLWLVFGEEIAPESADTSVISTRSIRNGPVGNKQSFTQPYTFRNNQRYIRENCRFLQLFISGKMGSSRRFFL